MELRKRIAGKIDSDDDDDASDADDSSDDGKQRVGFWTIRERERVAYAVKMYGTRDYKSIAAHVRTRTHDQTRMFLFRHFNSTGASDKMLSSNDVSDDVPEDVSQDVSQDVSNNRDSTRI